MWLPTPAGVSAPIRVQRTDVHTSMTHGSLSYADAVKATPSSNISARLPAMITTDSPTFDDPAATPSVVIDSHTPTSPTLNHPSISNCDSLPPFTLTIPT